MVTKLNHAPYISITLFYTSKRKTFLIIAKKILKKCLMDPISKLIGQFEKIKMKKYQYDDGKEIALTNSMRKIVFTRNGS